MTEPVLQQVIRVEADDALHERETSDICEAVERLLHSLRQDRDTQRRLGTDFSSHKLFVAITYAAIDDGE